MDLNVISSFLSKYCTLWNWKVNTCNVGVYKNFKLFAGFKVVIMKI